MAKSKPSETPAAAESSSKKANESLNEDVVKKLTSEGQPNRLVADKKQSGLYLRVSKTGRKTWMLRARVDRRWKVERLGEWKEVGAGLSVAQARLKAANALDQALRGGAPTREKVTLQQACDIWYENKVEPNYKRPEQTKHYLDRDLKPLASKQIGRITQDDLYALFTAKRRTSPGAVNKLVAITRQVFKYAVFRKWVAPGANPMLALTHDEVGTAAKPRERVLIDTEIRQAWAIPTPHGTLYRFLLASGQRLSEVLALAAEPEQVRGDMWHIEDNKSSRPHRVPVTPMMKKLLKDGLPKKRKRPANPS